MERFNLDTWLEDKSRKVVTKDGKSVRIICTDANEETPIAVLVTVNDMGQDKLATALYTKDGRYGSGNSSYDLFFADNEPNEPYNPYKVAVESILKMAEKYEPYCRVDIDSTLPDFLNNVKVKCKDAIEYDKTFPQEEFIPKKQYEEDLEQAYKNADKVQFNRGMDEVLNNPKRYFHVGDTIRLKNSTAEYKITSIFNGQYHGIGWYLDAQEAAKNYELVNTFSKQDEEMFDEIIDELTPYGECPDYPSERDKEYYYKRNDMIDWLKEKFQK